MVGWHHRLDGHEFERTPGNGEIQGSLACYSLLGRRESDTTGRVNNNKVREERKAGNCLIFHVTHAEETEAKNYSDSTSRVPQALGGKKARVQREQRESLDTADN